VQAAGPANAFTCERNHIACQIGESDSLHRVKAIRQTNRPDWRPNSEFS
jgi:hypothetical protein